MDNKQYNEQRYNRKKQHYRILLGFQQMINYPIINLIWILYVRGVVFVIQVLRKIVSSCNTYPLVEEIFTRCMNGILIAFVVLSAIGIIYFIGEITAIKDEALVFQAFVKDSGNTVEAPILKWKKTKKGVTTRVFYTTISMKEWEKKKDDICDKLDIHLIGDITYGGRNERVGYLRKMKSGKGRKPKEGGILYDDIL